ncbi:F0F1 ATP synthase subunit delta [Alkalibacillus haloalkaliphilus]|uniref:F0F1 ATP synthase subunit delta n=1 Tax=Alkalibacillus haloalkaliphilus TaxID=94136 RepID=UPI0002DAB65E|nr:F0F1 ATP synthase subunit delta [Alkalibacillus haloalkaliphilus]
MSNSAVANRYAIALFDIGTEKSNLPQLEEELNAVIEVFNQDKELNAFFDNPRVSKDEKKNFIREVFKSFSQETVNLLLVLTDKSRMNSLKQIVKSFVDMKNEARGIAEADVYSVRALTEEEQQQIQNVFAKKLDKNTLRINNIIDESILGGLKVRVGNQIFDGTVARKLQRIEQSVVSANK